MYSIPELSDRPVEFDPDEWPVIAHAEMHSLVSSGRYVQQQLHVRRNRQGEVLAYSCIRDGDVVTPFGSYKGTPSDSNALFTILCNAVGNIRGNRYLVETCHQQIERGA